jgi:GntR family transcriptional regulator
MSLAGACAAELSRAIARGTYPAGGRLPSEEELALELGVSRATVRDALRSLADRGLIVRRHGRGTYVADRPIKKDLSRNFGITTMIRAAGYHPTTAERTITTARARPDVADRLAIAPGDPVVTLSRLRLADGRPVVASTEVLPLSVVEPEDLEALADEHQSLYGLLFKLRGVVIYRGEAELAPVAATRDLARRLGVRPGAPLLRINQVDYDGSGNPVLYSVEYHVGDWVRFSVERMGPGPGVDV